MINYSRIAALKAGVAQLVEQPIRNRQVGRSIRLAGTNPTPPPHSPFLYRICNMAENHKETPNSTENMLQLLEALHQNFERHHYRHYFLEKFLLVVTIVVLIVAAYVFFLIFAITADMHDINRHLNIIATQIVPLSEDLHGIRSEMRTTNKSITVTNKTLQELSKSTICAFL